jgi:hypothetical protein
MAAASSLSWRLSRSIALVHLVQAQHTAEALLRQIGTALRQLALGLLQQALRGAVARHQVGGAVLGVARFGPDGFLILEQARFHLVLGDQLVGFAEGHLSGAAAHADGDRQHGGQRGAAAPCVQMTSHQSNAPILICCTWFKGR